MTTGRIIVLSPEVVAHIAAGETVDRPASVLKELLENSLDAGAGQVAVEVVGSVDRHLRVADDGEGILADDLPLAFTRHATSKLARVDDLARIGSLGFRGEALASIAQVARVAVATRRRDAADGVETRVEGGRITSTRPIARAPGTTVQVEDLFFNAPARRKFLRSAVTESRAATRLVSTYALAVPRLKLSLVTDGREVLALAPAESLETRLAALYGPRLAEQLLPVSGERDGVAVRGVIGVPEAARATREHQYLFVNGRPVQNPLLAYLVRRAYGTMVPDGRHPFFVLEIALDPALVDVNVHPTKREVRFAREGEVTLAVTRAVENALRALAPRMSLAGSGGGGGTGFVRDRPGGGALADELADLAQARQTTLADQLYAPPPRGSGRTVTGAAAAAPAGAIGPEERPYPDSPFWQLHGTWVFAPVKSGFIIVDQHAAHERIAYEQIRARLRGSPAPSQALLFPEVLDLTAAEYEALLGVHGALEKLGFDIRAVSGNSVVVRGIPADLRTWNGGMFLRDLLADTEELEAADPGLTDALAASYACHSVVRARQPLVSDEMGALIDALFRAERPEACPHGRPTFVRIGLDELEKRFGRR